jgi:hypothetical protein
MNLLFMSFGQHIASSNLLVQYLHSYLIHVRRCMGMVSSVWFALIRTWVLKFLIILKNSNMPCFRNFKAF